MMINVDNRLLEILKEQTGAEVTFKQVKEANAIRRVERVYQNGASFRSKCGQSIKIPGSLCRKLDDAECFGEVQVYIMKHEFTSKSDFTKLNDYIRSFGVEIKSPNRA